MGLLEPFHFPIDMTQIELSLPQSDPLIGTEANLPSNLDEPDTEFSAMLAEHGYEIATPPHTQEEFARLLTTAGQQLEELIQISTLQ